MIDNYDIIRLQQNILNRFNKPLHDKGNRVAYYFINYADKLHIQREYTEKMTLICLIHNIGAYKQSNREEHSNPFINGYMFFKYFSPYKRNDKNIYYANANYDKNNNDLQYNNGVLLHLFRTVDDLVMAGKTNAEIINSLQKATKFNPIHVYLITNLIQEGMLDKVRDNSYQSQLKNHLMTVFYDRKNNIYDYLKMVLYTFVYYSEETLTHCQTTALIAKTIGEKMGLSASNINKLYVGALVHDVGKIDVPNHILDNPKELTPEEYEIIKTHVESSKDILKDIFDQDIVNMAYHHHERLDGSGYPNKLKADDLTLFDRILAVSDTVSAIHEPRCYQQPYTKDEMIQAMTNQSENNKLDANIVKVFIDNIDEIVHDCDIVVNDTRNSYKVFEREINLLYSVNAKNQQKEIIEKGDEIKNIEDVQNVENELNK